MPFSSAHFSIILNGSPRGFSPASKRGGGGRSTLPILFTFVAHSLSQMIIHAESKSLFKGFLKGIEKVNVSDLQFADDRLVLMDGPRFGHILKSLIQCFKLVSWLKVNWSKSHILIIALTNFQCLQMANLLGMLSQRMAFRILGITVGGTLRRTDF